MSFFSDFKKFLMKGDIVALATAVVIGAAFKSIVDSVVKDVITPIIGLLTGGGDFTKKFIALDGHTYASLDAAREAKAAVITYGNLIQALINFVIVGRHGELSVLSNYAMSVDSAKKGDFDTTHIC